MFYFTFSDEVMFINLTYSLLCRIIGYMSPATLLLWEELAFSCVSLLFFLMNYFFSCKLIRWSDPVCLGSEMNRGQMPNSSNIILCQQGQYWKEQNLCSLCKFIGVLFGFFFTAACHFSLSSCFSWLVFQLTFFPFVVFWLKWVCTQPSTFPFTT